MSIVVTFLPASVLCLAAVGDCVVPALSQELAVAILAAPAPLVPVVGGDPEVVQYYGPFDNYGTDGSLSFGWLDGLSMTLP